jgi:toxin CcdB
MAQQYDVWRMASGTHVVVIQSDLLEAMQTRVVVPLLPADQAGPPLPPLTPVIDQGVDPGRLPLVLMPQLTATLTLAELGTRVGSAAASRDAITRALDALLSGV